MVVDGIAPGGPGLPGQVAGLWPELPWSSWPGRPVLLPGAVVAFRLPQASQKLKGLGVEGDFGSEGKGRRGPQG